MESNTGVIVAKWKDKRDVLFLSTKHKPTMVNVESRSGCSSSKPIAIVDYNEAKSFIDVSDQKASYASTVRKGVKWYRKIGIEVLTNTAIIVNSHFVFQKVTGKKMCISDFREQIVLSLLQDTIEYKSPIANEPINNQSHIITSTEKKGRCNNCYLKLSKQFGRQHAIKNCKQVQQNCKSCVSKFMCNDCFFKLHNTTLK